MMRRRIGLGLLAGLLAVATTHAAPADISAAYETAKRRALEVHAALIPKAAPAVRAKISASALAGRTYLSGCRQDCDFYGFLVRDLRVRFPRSSERERELLALLVFAETTEKLEVQRAKEMQKNLLETFQKMEKTRTAGEDALIQNLRP